jgi:hypothetical protein
MEVPQALGSIKNGFINFTFHPNFGIYYENFQAEICSHAYVEVSHALRAAGDDLIR